MSTHKTIAANLRESIKAAGIRARVRVAPGGGSVQVNAPEYGITFSGEDQAAVRSLAVSLGCTLVRGMPIDVARDTNPNGFEFYHQ